MTGPGVFDKTEGKVALGLGQPCECTLDKSMGGVLPSLPQRVALATDRTTNYCLPSAPVNVDKCATFPAKDRAKAFVLHDRSPMTI